KILLPTSFSDIVNPGTSLFVLSERRQRTPSSPISAIFVKFAGSPTGVKLNLKSPVCTIFPGGVLTTTPYERSEDRRVGKVSKRDWSSDVCSSDLKYYCRLLFLTL